MGLPAASVHGPMRMCNPGPKRCCARPPPLTPLPTQAPGAYLTPKAIALSAYLCELPLLDYAMLEHAPSRVASAALAAAAAWHCGGGSSSVNMALAAIGDITGAHVHAFGRLRACLSRVLHCWQGPCRFSQQPPRLPAAHACRLLFGRPHRACNADAAPSAVCCVRRRRSSLRAVHVCSWQVYGGAPPPPPPFARLHRTKPSASSMKHLLPDLISATY